ncbi:hypothetical protein DV736_g6256, partial [Chaetothyriales sp. CBS 134916]
MAQTSAHVWHLLGLFLLFFFCTAPLLSRSGASLALALAAQEPVSEHVDPNLIPDNERRKNYWAHGGHDLVHEVWSGLRDSEPATKESAASVKPSGVLLTAWHYTKIVLKALFLNTPASKKNTHAHGTDTVKGGLKKAVDALTTAAALDDPDAIFLLAEMNLHGNFSHPRKPQRALEWYSRLANLNGNATAQYALGLLYATGIGGVERDQAKALLYHTFAAEQGNIRSEMSLAFRHHAGIGSSRDCNKAVDYYKRVADKAMQYWRSGPPGGQHLVRNSYRWVEVEGGAYGEGASASSSGPNAKQDGTVVTSIDDLLEYLSMKESSGDYWATFQLGKHYYDPPRGYKRNVKKAQRQFVKLARAYWTKDGKVSAKAPKGIEKTAGKAAAYIGRMFMRGEDMEQNFNKAMTWFKRGMSNGDAYAQFHLGIMHRDGLGVQADGARAAQFFKAAAEQGLAVAQSAMGVLFLDQGDIDTAGRYFELAASAGVTEAFYYLAELTHNGLGRDRNCGLASVYYKIVAERTEILHSAFNEANAAFERGDWERAFIPSIMAAEQGYESAQANAAFLLDEQMSMVSVSSIPLLSSPTRPASRLLKNAELALVYYTRSSKQANVDSLVKMGDYYLAGVTTTSATWANSSKRSEIDKAVTCYTTAAEAHRSAQAFWNLGWMHENGIGSVAQDFHMAKRYYDLAYEMNKEAYLPVKLALLKLRLRSWWNHVSGGKVNPIREDEDDKKGQPKTLLEWLNRFIDAALEMDQQEAMVPHEGDDMDLDSLAFGETAIPGGGGDEHAGRRHDYGGDEWDEFDDGLVESLVIVALAGALALLVYARQQRQRENGQQAQAPPNTAAAGQGPGQLADQAAPQQPPAQAPGQGAGYFPHPADPEFNNWAAGGIGH